MKTITTAILSLLFLLGVAALMVWLLPVKVMLTVLSVVQLLTLVILGSIITDLKDHRKDHE